MQRVEVSVAESWDPRPIATVDEFDRELGRLKERGWLFRGQSKTWGSLIPSIDRPPRELQGRAVKLFIERRSIEAFRENVRRPMNQSESLALSDPHIALMVLRHYDVPTRIMDWSASQHVAGFFACEGHEGSDAELWAFDRLLYQSEGLEQWDVGPPVTRNGEFHPKYTMFMAELGSIDWFICSIYFPQTFPRQNAQEGWFSLTPRFEVDHACHIARLLKTPDACLRFIIPARLKLELLTHLWIKHGVRRSVLFPDLDLQSQSCAIAAAKAVFIAH